MKAQICWLSFVTVFLFFYLPSGGSTAHALEDNVTTTLYIDSKQIVEISSEGKRVWTGTAHTQVKGGVTYVPLRTMGEMMGMSINFDQSTNEYFLKSPAHEIRFKKNASSYKYNGHTYDYDHGEAFIENSRMLVPVRTFTEHLGARLFPRMEDKQVIIHWNRSYVQTGTENDVDIELEAKFSTDKDKYKIGEEIEYSVKSTITGSKERDRTWTNRQPVFFEPGVKEITLELKNQLGDVDTYTTYIEIEDEVLRSREQYYGEHGALGERFAIDRAGVLDYPVVEYDLEEIPYPLIRVNSPEQIDQEGFYYKDRLEGAFRLMLHHQNNRTSPVNFYIVATNPHSSTTTVTKTHSGFSGPHQYVSPAGKNSVSRYLESLQSDSFEEYFLLEPNEKKVIAPELAQVSVGKGQVLTGYYDFESDLPVDYELIVLDQENDLQRTLPYLYDVNADRDGIHVRGTFEHGNRTLTVSEELGANGGSRIPVADGSTDFYMTGKDMMEGTDETNKGNYGLLYDLKLEKVAPNTAIIINPRGGHYSGAFIVNGQLVKAPEVGYIPSPEEAVVLYRTGDQAEEVNIQFVPASGSNLPINLLAIPYLK